MYRLNKLMIYIAFILFSFIGKVNAIIKPTQEFYVNDYANILSQETETYIIEKSKVLNNADGTQIVVVTVPNLEDKAIEEYALELARNFGIGAQSKNNGLLLLLALEEREFRVEVGYGLEGILNDSKTGRFQDKYIIPYLRENDWDNGIINGYNAFYTEIVKLNNLSLDYTEPEPATNMEDIMSVIIMIIIFIIAIIYITKNNGNFSFYGPSAGNFYSGKSHDSRSSFGRGSSGGGGSFGGGGSSRKF